MFSFPPSNGWMDKWNKKNLAKVKKIRSAIYNVWTEIIQQGRNPAIKTAFPRLIGRHLT